MHRSGEFVDADGAVPRHDFDPSSYSSLLDAKLATTRATFAAFLAPAGVPVDVEVFASDPVHYRFRCKFVVAPVPETGKPPRRRVAHTGAGISGVPNLTVVRCEGWGRLS